MTEEGRKKKKGKRGRRKGKEFMDAVHEAYLRHLVEEIWADLEGVLKTGTTGGSQEAKWITEFEDRGPYKEIWQRAWHTFVPQQLESQPAWAIVLGIQEVVEAASREEEAERQRRGDKSFFDEEQYHTFVSEALEKLFKEEHGSIEEEDEI
ncbi:MAG: hypothetical protein U9R33_04405 [candidate division NC10 bacterium]|nr:hypothetical protein [candidate division NC10 bacterium]